MKLFTSLAIAATLIGAPVMADSDHISSKQLLRALEAEPSQIWVRLIKRSDLATLAFELDLSLNQLKELNELDSNTPLEAGTWVVLPSGNTESISASKTLDVTQIRESPPLKTPLAPMEVVEIQSNKSLMSLVREHGITLTQLKAFNPGVELSKLIVGSKVRVAKARKDLAVRPLRSSGDSWPDLPWPDLPSLPGSSRTIPVGTTYKAPDSAQKQAIREQIERQREKERIAAARRADAERAARLRREEARRRRYREIGGCTYDWQSWGKSPSGVRSVKAFNCGGVTEVAVDCNNTKISKLSWSKWRSWEVPSTGFEDLVVESCANVLGAAQPRYIEPILPAAAPAPKPRTTTVSTPTSTCTGPTVLCGLP